MSRVYILFSILALCFATRVHADVVPVQFSGGNDSPITFTLTDPITYTATATDGGVQFLFQDDASAFGGVGGAGGTMTYTVNGGAPTSVTYMGNGGVTAGAQQPDNLILFGPAVSPGDVVVLSAGSLTSTSSIGPAAPASGSFETFLLSNGKTDIGEGSVPEPASLSLFAVAGITLLRRRRRASHTVRP